MDNETYFHTAAFRLSVTNGTTNTPLAGVADTILTKAASGAFLAPPQSRIRLAVAGGVNASRARIDTPKMREIGLPYIAPLNQTVVVPSPPNLADYGEFGPAPEQDDEINVQSTHTDAAPQIQFAGIWLKFNRREVPTGKRYRLRFTGAIAGVVGSWANGAITFDQTLPASTYAIVGLDVFGTNLYLARLIFAGGGWRPGCLARNAVNSVPLPVFNDGSLGCYGKFRSVNPPNLDIYCEGANAAQEGYMDVVDVGN